MNVFGFTYTRDSHYNLVLTPTISERDKEPRDITFMGVRIVSGKNLKNYDDSVSKIVKFVCRDWHSTDLPLAVIVQDQLGFVIHFTDDAYLAQRGEKVVGVLDNSKDFYNVLTKVLTDELEDLEKVYAIITSLENNDPVKAKNIIFEKMMKDLGFDFSKDTNNEEPEDDSDEVEEKELEDNDENYDDTEDVSDNSCDSILEELFGMPAKSEPQEEVKPVSNDIFDFILSMKNTRMEPKTTDENEKVNPDPEEVEEKDTPMSELERKLDDIEKLLKRYETGNKPE